MSELTAIAPYLKDPLVLAGFIIIGFFGLAKVVIKSGLLSQISGQRSYQILKSILAYGFVLGLLIVLLGFGLKYRELSTEEQKHAVSLLRGELAHNLATARSLQQNTITFLQLTQDTANVLRNPAIKYVSALFPAENLSEKPNRTPRKMAEDGIAYVVLNNIDQMQLERARMIEAVRVMRGTIARTLPVVDSLSDQSRNRFTIKNSVWNTQLPILRKVNIEGISAIQTSYQDLERLRADYDVTVVAIERYLRGLDEFFGNKAGLSIEGLTSILTVERQTFTIIATYANGIVACIERLSKLEVQLGRT